MDGYWVAQALTQTVFFVHQSIAGSLPQQQ